MAPIIVGFAAGVAFMLLLVVWLVGTHQKLSVKWRAMTHAAAEWNLHRSLYESERDGPQREQAARMLDISRRLYEESRLDYQLTRRKPLYRIPGVLMGFRMIAKDDAL